MAIYAYECTSCGHTHNDICKLSEKKDVLPCPECNSESKFTPFPSDSRGTALKFRGGGWYCTNPDNYN